MKKKSAKDSIRPLIIGLTGSIGMGKSTVAKQLTRLGWSLHSADQATHDLLAQGGKAVKTVSKIFPESLKDGAIDRKVLGRTVFKEPGKLKKLEKILHPLVEKEEEKAVKKAAKDKARVLIVEIPLLFETKAEKRCDFTICVSASPKAQKERVLKRKGMTEEKLRAILKQQMPDSEKRRRADFVIKTDGPLADTYKQIKKLWPEIQKKAGRLCAR